VLANHRLRDPEPRCDFLCAGGSLRAVGELDADEVRGNDGGCTNAKLRQRRRRSQAVVRWLIRPNTSAKPHRRQNSRRWACRAHTVASNCSM
jgi:hypothetical protein